MYMKEEDERISILLSEINYLVDRIIPKEFYPNFRQGDLDIKISSEMPLLGLHTPVIRESTVTEVLFRRGASRWRQILFSDESLAIKLQFTYPMGILSMRWSSRGSCIESLLQNGPIYVPQQDRGGSEVREMRRLHVLKETLTAVSHHVPTPPKQ